MKTRHIAAVVLLAWAASCSAQAALLRFDCAGMTKITIDEGSKTVVFTDAGNNFTASYAEERIGYLWDWPPKYRAHLSKHTGTLMFWEPADLPPGNLVPISTSTSYPCSPLR